MTSTRALSVLAGLAIAAGLPPWGWWPLSIVGISLWFHLIDRAAPRTRFRRSLIVGASWACPSTLWMFDLTPVGWPVEVGLFTLVVAGVGWLTPSQRPSRRIVFPAALALGAMLRWNFPLGGVPIATLAMVGASTPFAMSARLFGSPLLVVMMAVAGMGLTDLARRNLAAPAVASLVLVAATLGGHLAGSAVETVGEIRVAVVQGGGPQNTRADICANRGVFERHMTVSESIEEPVDLVLWPEDVVHPREGTTPARCTAEQGVLLSAAEALERLQALAVDVEATLITGWFEPSDDREANVNYSLVIDSHGRIGDRYDKALLVPFGEYVPLRSLIERFSDELPARDVRAGTGPAVLDTEFGPVGVSISWEVFFGHRARDAIGNGGRVLLNPTNGSSYWLTILQSQQVASSRLRALETDRWVLQSAPTGFSTIVDPDAGLHGRIGVEDPGVLFETIQLREGRTLAVAWGVWPVLLAGLGIMFVTRGPDVRRWIRSRQRG